MGEQALVQLAGEQGDAVHPGLMAKQITSEADLAAAAGTPDTSLNVQWIDRR
jgi:hypothetical protein